jgi:7,8-dihydropterin-6-yl-methyl-4-(beta-D-ribofuranosyl)aminobenzene 5'-phosphate synthase
MGSPSVSLHEVNRVEVLTLMDNYADVLLPNTDVVKRPPRAKGGKIPTDTLLAEHGLSLLITLHGDDKRRSFLLDTGYSSVGVLHNMELLAIDPAQIETIVLSHGHMDHGGTLYSLLDRIPGPISLVVHPEAFLSPRYFEFNDGRRRLFPDTLKRSELERRKVRIMESAKPVLIAGDTALVTGEVERKTDFEKGLPDAFLERNGVLEKDSVLDDQAIVVKLRGKGLVVISGCAHAGIVNTLRYAAKLTGEDHLHAVLGGFHLSGASFEPIIEETIQELKKFDPQIVVPMHCTGWKAIHRFSEEFPGSFILSCVGSRFTLS